MIARVLEASFGLVVWGILVATALASASSEVSQGVKYRRGKDIDFEALVIQGQLKRPEVSVVTGNSALGTDGLLRLRENFLDQMAQDTGHSLEGELR